MAKYANQYHITVHNIKPKKDSDGRLEQYGIITNRAFSIASKRLGLSSALSLWTYLCLQKNGNNFDLSPAYLNREYGMTEKTIRTARKKLIECGFLEVSPQSDLVLDFYPLGNTNSFQKKPPTKRAEDKKDNEKSSAQKVGGFEEIPDKVGTEREPSLPGKIETAGHLGSERAEVLQENEVGTKRAEGSAQSVGGPGYQTVGVTIYTYNIINNISRYSLTFTQEDILDILEKLWFDGIQEQLDDCKIYSINGNIIDYDFKKLSMGEGGFKALLSMYEENRPALYKWFVDYCNVDKDSNKIKWLFKGIESLKEYYAKSSES